MNKENLNTSQDESVINEKELVAARRNKLAWMKDELQIDPWGNRVDGLISLKESKSLFNKESHDAYSNRETDSFVDKRKSAKVSGRVIQHRAMGKLVFFVLRDDTGDLQISCSKSSMKDADFRLAKKLDYGDIVVADGPVGATNKGEICIWADHISLHSKSLAPPPGKHHGLADEELRARRRYVDMYANPEALEKFQKRSWIVSSIRKFMESRKFLEVETPMMQSIAGGAAARPFETYHNALSLNLFLRIAPELYLKRLLVGGMKKVFEINRNFRNEGISRKHNPEFTMLEAYEAFGNHETMLTLTEEMIRCVAKEISSNNGIIRWEQGEINYTQDFVRKTYADCFKDALGFSMENTDLVRKKALGDNFENAEKKDHWLLVSDLFEKYAEKLIDPLRPTFLVDYPSAISPLTRPHKDNPDLSYRWELFIGGMEIANAYTELNDPDLQLDRFINQLEGDNDEGASVRSLDEDFIDALRVGMPPAGGLGIGIDRLVMLLTSTTSIRDVILFPLLRPQEVS